METKETYIITLGDSDFIYQQKRDKTQITNYWRESLNHSIASEKCEYKFSCKREIAYVYSW